MASASVDIKEIDLSTRVPSFPGVFGAIQIEATKGPVGEPQLMTSDSALLNTYTPDGRIEVGYDTAYFSALAFLEKSSTLWVNRVANNALFGGLGVKTAASATGNFTAPAGITDPSAYVFDGMPDVAGVAEVTAFTFTGVTGVTLDTAGAAQYVTFRSALDATIYYAWFDVTDGANAQSDPAPGGTGIKVDVLSADLDTAIATKFDAAVLLAAAADFSGGAVVGAIATLTNLLAGATADATAGTVTGASVVVTTQGVTEVDQVDECLFIYGANPGVWNNQVLVKIITDPDIVKEPDAFLIHVFKSSNISTPVETWLCSRIEGKLDGNNANIYIEDVLEGSNFIRALTNPAIADNILPQAQITVLALGGGDDGSAVTSGNLVTASTAFANPDNIFFTVFMDGGRADPAYALALTNLVSSRLDSIAVLSVPFSAEASATYLNDIIEYRKISLNINNSYAALYTPHVKILDRFNDRNIFISPEGYAAAAISFSANNFEVWFPPAGAKRGVVNVLDLRRRFSKGEMDALYDEGINPLRFVPGKGILIWGQKTLSSRPSALDRLNVRLLLITIEPAIAESLADFLFDLNDEATRSIASAIVSSAMDNVQARRGVTSFSVVSDSTNNTAEDIDNNRMNLDLFLIPTRAVETIPFRVVITRTGVDFNTAAASI